MTTHGSILRIPASQLTQTPAPTWVITTVAEHGPLIHGISLIFHTELPGLPGDNHGTLLLTSIPTLDISANLTQSFINLTMQMQEQHKLPPETSLPPQLQPPQLTHTTLDTCGSSVMTINLLRDISSRNAIPLIDSLAENGAENIAAPPITFPQMCQNIMNKHMDLPKLVLSFPLRLVVNLTPHTITLPNGSIKHMI